MIDVFERLKYTCISTIHFLCLELQEDIVQFCIVLGKYKHCSGGAGGFHCVDRYSDSNGGIRGGIPSMYINRTTHLAVKQVLESHQVVHYQPDSLSNCEAQHGNQLDSHS